MFVSAGVLNHTPVHPNHHIATFPGATTSFLNIFYQHVPHSGKVLSIQLCLVISLILLMNLSPFDYNVFLLLRVYYHLHFYISTYFHHLHKCAFLHFFSA